MGSFLPSFCLLDLGLKFDFAEGECGFPPIQVALTLVKFVRLLFAGCQSSFPLLQLLSSAVQIVLAGVEFGLTLADPQAG